jgi:hypothetical protein
MAEPRWYIKGQWLEYCSCDYGCPCESMAPPTQGHCDGVVGMHIEEGYYGDVRLDGLSVVTIFFFPRAIHHGGGEMQAILEERTTQGQRDALFKILSGEGQPIGTLFQIFSVIVETFHPPLFLPIKFEWDIDKRAGRIEVPGIVRASTMPIRNPVTDKEQRILTVLPEGKLPRATRSAPATSSSISRSATARSRLSRSITKAWPIATKRPSSVSARACSGCKRSRAIR